MYIQFQYTPTNKLFFYISLIKYNTGDKMTKEPYYLETNNEISKFKAAYEENLAVMLKGPTGCGKTTFVEYMADKLKSGIISVKKNEDEKLSYKVMDYTDVGLVTVACNEDLSASDLLGHYIFKDNETKWVDGPMLSAVKNNKILYLDEVIESRNDVLVLIHPLSDHRRILPVDKLGQIYQADDGFMLVVSYNPGYQSIKKDFKQSTRQRFSTISMDYPEPNIETKIIQDITSIDKKYAKQLVNIANKIRNLKTQGLSEGASTRLLINAAKYIKNHNMDPYHACDFAINQTITDRPEMNEAIEEIILTQFKKPR